MKKLWVNFWVDVTSLVIMASMAVTGVVMKYAVPSGQGRRRGSGLGPETWLGLSRHEWGDLHFYLALLLLTLIGLHLVLHWSWIKCRLRELGGRGRGPSCGEGVSGDN